MALRDRGGGDARAESASRRRFGTAPWTTPSASCTRSRRSSSPLRRAGFLLAAMVGAAARRCGGGAENADDAREPRLHADRAAGRDRDRRDHRRDGVRRAQPSHRAAGSSHASVPSAGRTIQLAMRLDHAGSRAAAPARDARGARRELSAELARGPERTVRARVQSRRLGEPRRTRARHGVARGVQLGRRQARALALGGHGSHVVDAARAHRAPRRRHERRSAVSRHALASGTSNGRRSTSAARRASSRGRAPSSSRSSSRTSAACSVWWRRADELRGVATRRRFDHGRARRRDRHDDRRESHVARERSICGAPRRRWPRIKD